MSINKLARYLARQLSLHLFLPVAAFWVVSAQLGTAQLPNPLGGPDCIMSGTVSTVVTNQRVQYDNRQTSSSQCIKWNLLYENDGLSTVSIEIDEAPDSSNAPGAWVTWPTANLASGTLPLTSTISGQITATKFFPWVSVLVTTTGTGTLRWWLYGYRPAALGDAGTNLIGSVFEIPKTACGSTVASQPLGAVPTVATAVFIATTCVMVILLNNTTGASLTVTASDNQGTPVNDLLTFSIPANSQLIQPLWGVQFTSGVRWNASGTGVTGAILGYQ